MYRAVFGLPFSRSKGKGKEKYSSKPRPPPPARGNARVVLIAIILVFKIRLENLGSTYLLIHPFEIISENQDTDKWYEFFDDFASLLNHPKSLVRNRVLYILAANAQWDDENRFDAILNDYLTHVIDEKPITAR